MYKLLEYLSDILYVLKTGIAWRDLRSHINWNSVYKVYIKLNSFKIFEISYIYLLNKYLKKSPNGKLRYVMTDTTFIPNKRGREMIGYNKYYNKKNGTKISLITDSNGKVLDVKCYEGNKNDGDILLDQLEQKNAIVQLTHLGIRNRYFLADPAYDSKKVRDKLGGMKYDPIISQNRRNTKDPSKLKRLTKHEKKIYIKRLKIENTNNNIKNNRKICLRYEHLIKNFMGFVYLALIKTIC